MYNNQAVNYDQAEEVDVDDAIINAPNNYNDIEQTIDAEAIAEAVSSGTAVPLDDLSNPISNMYTADIPRKRLKRFMGLPDFVTKPSLFIPVVVKQGEDYGVIGLFEKVAQVTDPDAMVRVLVIVLRNASDMDIAFEKWAYMDRALGGGGISSAERIWMAAHFPAIIASDPSIKSISGHGGSRKGASYMAASFPKKLIAARLNMPESVAQKQLYYGKYFYIDTLRIFAERRLERRFFESINSRKKGLIDSLKGKSDAEITELVSKNGLVWMHQYLDAEEERVAKAKASKEAARDRRAAKAAELKRAGKGKKAQTASADSDEIIEGEAFLNTPQNEMGEAALAGGDHLASPDGSTPGGVFSFLPESGKTSSVIFDEIFQLGKKLTEISVKKPQKQELCQELRVVLGQLNKIMTSLAEDQDSSTATTLANAA